MSATDATAQSSSEASEDNSSRDECIMMELSWQRNPMQNATAWEITEYSYL